ncbi:MAG: hypothetical protein AB7T06_03890 [Kofleriaceae bacterium]
MRDEVLASRVLRGAVILAALACATAARADTIVTVQLSPDGQQLAQQLGVTPEQLAAQVKRAVDDARATRSCAPTSARRRASPRTSRCSSG